MRSKPAGLPKRPPTASYPDLNADPKPSPAVSNSLIGESTAIRKVVEQVKQVAATNAVAFIAGETGTGKELIANLLHQFSLRSKQVLIKLNCATLQHELIESELFGHQKGAFTGAAGKRIGKFELASEGTLFLDEVGELPLQVQAKLLRVLQNGEFYPLGSNQVKVSRTRIITATNRTVEQLVAYGTFRKDLFYRLNVFPIRIPPLRERRSDIPLLARHFLRKYARALDKVIFRFDREAMTQLQDFDYPGNVRELENIIERAVIVCNGSVILSEHLLFSSVSECTDRDEMLTPFLDLKEAQKRHILAALQRTDWKISGPNGAASLLNVNPKTLHSKMNRLGIVKPE